jgi:capsular exopolysaccharide synthesis family protein
MQLRHYAWVFRRWLWLILLGTAFCAGATYEISKHMTPVYQTSALVQVNGSGLSSSDYNSVLSAQALAQSYALLLNDPDVLATVAQKLPGVTVSELQSAVNVSPDANTQIIEVQAQAPNPQLAANIANEVAQVFIQREEANLSAQLQSIASQLSQNLVKTKSDMDAAEEKLSSLQSANASSDQITHQQDIYNTYQTNYSALLLSYNQVQLEQLAVKNSLSMAQKAVPPDKPKSPQPSLDTILAAALGLLLMLTLALLLDWLDTSIKTPDDVARIALLEPLGSIPVSKRPLLCPTPPNASAVNDDRVEQAFVTISTSFSALNRGQRAILVTGLRGGAGATTTAVNLAIALAQTGTRVLLIDANLRRPALHEIFRCANTKGLANSLTDVYLFSEAEPGIVNSWLNQWATNLPNLWLLPAGPEPSHPAAILRTPELRMLCDWLLRPGQSSAGNAITRPIDLIIFDSLALEDAADTIALATSTSATVLVIQAGKEQRETLQKAQTTLQRLGSPVLGVVINRQRSQHRPYFYADRYQHTSIQALVDGAETGQATTDTRTLGTRPLFEQTPPALPVLPANWNHQDHSGSRAPDRREDWLRASPRQD